MIYKFKHQTIKTVCNALIEKNILLMKLPERESKYKRKWKEDIIQSVLKYTILPTFILNSIENTDTLHCLDGNMRLNILYSFYLNKLFVTIDGKKQYFKSLSQKNKDIFLNTKLQFIIIEDPLTIVQKIDVFRNYNNTKNKHIGELLYQITDNNLINYVKEYIKTKDWKDLQHRLNNKCTVKSRMFVSKYDFIEFIFNIISLYKNNKLLQPNEFFSFDFQCPDHVLRLSIELLKEVLSSIEYANVKNINIIKDYIYEPLIKWFKEDYQDKQLIFDQNLQKWSSLTTKCKRKRFKHLNKYKAKQEAISQIIFNYNNPETITKYPVTGPLDKYVFTLK